MSPTDTGPRGRQRGSAASDEASLIAAIARQAFSGAGALGSAAEGIGDDCAVVALDRRRSLLVSTDTLVEDVHFRRRDFAWRQVGAKATAQNLSDIAAMGGRPAGMLLALTLPADIDPRAGVEIVAGMRRLCREFHCPLWGGNLSSAPRGHGVVVNVTVLGIADPAYVVRRDGARPRDVVCVTGTLGDARAAVRILEGPRRTAKRTRDERRLLQAQFAPRPRIVEGELIARGGATAMLDISDGVARDLPRIAQASGVSIDVDVAALPVSPVLRRWAAAGGIDAPLFALGGGEEFQLLFTIPEKRFVALRRRWPARLAAISVIGRVTRRARNGKVRYLRDGRVLAGTPVGYDHFARVAAKG